jgi:hypothetical protein
MLNREIGVNVGHFLNPVFKADNITESVVKVGSAVSGSQVFIESSKDVITEGARCDVEGKADKSSVCIDDGDDPFLKSFRLLEADNHRDNAVYPVMGKPLALELKNNSAKVRARKVLWLASTQSCMSSQLKQYITCLTCLSLGTFLAWKQRQHATVKQQIML